MLIPYKCKSGGSGGATFTFINTPTRPTNSVPGAVWVNSSISGVTAIDNIACIDSHATGVMGAPTSAIVLELGSTKTMYNGGAFWFTEFIAYWLHVNNTWTRFTDANAAVFGSGAWVTAKS